jgi:polypeptide N-acetylgalactosaminyltransferase
VIIQLLFYSLVNVCAQIMLLKCPRIKRVYLKFCTTVFVIVIVILYLRPLLTHQVSGNAKLISKLASVYEKTIKDYENKIIPNLGHDGAAAYLEGTDAKEGDKALKKFALNTVLSDRMPLDRKLRDPRNPKCKTFTYNPKLKASVVVIFYNELLSVILRTVWSVILQTPKHLLQEIILVDDSSTDETLKGLLDYYIDTRLANYNVKLIHLKSRMGLIRARLQGARIATGDVLIFLDAHCEATKNWIEPLLSRIEEDNTAVLVPIIDVIEANTLAYSTNGDTSYQVGGFSWSGHFTWIDIQNEEDKHKLTPVKSPTMAGGLFAIDRKFFWEIGSYDEQMDGWGGENLEMSFRIWQCGGRLETVPCSRVGHIFRDFHPYSFPDNKDTHGINTARLAHVWMDDYKRFFFMYQPALENNPIVGDLTHRQQLRQKLRCKSFKWFLENVYPEKFIPDENVFGYGQVQNEYGMCFDDLQLGEDKIGPLGLYQCHPYLAMSQYFSLSFKGELRKENFCAETFGSREVQLTECHGHKREQFWKLFKNGTIYNPTSGKCLSSMGVENGKGVVMETCTDSIFQRWRFTNVNKTAVVV